MPRLPARLFAFSPLLAALVACGSSSSDTTPASPAQSDAPSDPGTPAGDPGPTVDNGAPSTTYPAPHPPLPELVNQAGGKVLTAPKIYLVVYPGYEPTAALQTFSQKLGASSYWGATTKEYGVGAITYAGTKELSETAPTTISDADVETFMHDKIAAGELGTPDTNTVYAIFYPSTTTITSASGPLGSGKSCSSFGGYHADTPVAVNGKTDNYAFAVLPTCAGFGALSGIDELTGAFSHELVEAVTDPFPTTNNGANSAYATVDMDHFIWILSGGTEAGDLCVPEPDAFSSVPELGTVQRSWSNVSGKAGHDPCVPAVSSAYFQSAPVLAEDVTLTLPAQFGGSDVPTKGVTIPVGQSKTIEVDLYSDGPTSGPWTVSAEDALARLGGGATLDFSWDRTQGVNGEKLHLTVTVKGASSFVPGAHPFTITSKLGTKTATWPGLVVEK
jgi:hypothetical protein